MRLGQAGHGVGSGCQHLGGVHRSVSSWAGQGCGWEARAGWGAAARTRFRKRCQTALPASSKRATVLMKRLRGRVDQRRGQQRVEHQAADGGVAELEGLARRALQRQRAGVFEPGAEPRRAVAVVGIQRCGVPQRGGALRIGSRQPAEHEHRAELGALRHEVRQALAQRGHAAGQVVGAQMQAALEFGQAEDAEARSRASQGTGRSLRPVAPTCTASQSPRHSTI